jgi:hypothetical protein
MVERSVGVATCMLAIGSALSTRLSCTHQRFLEPLGRHHGAYNIHGQLEVSRTALGEARAEDAVKCIGVRCVGLSRHLIE